MIRDRSCPNVAGMCEGMLNVKIYNAPMCTYVCICMDVYIDVYIFVCIRVCTHTYIRNIHKYVYVYTRKFFHRNPVAFVWLSSYLCEAGVEQHSYQAPPLSPPPSPLPPRATKLCIKLPATASNQQLNISGMNVSSLLLTVQSSLSSHSHS